MGNDPTMLNFTQSPNFQNEKPYLKQYFMTIQVLAHVWPAIFFFGIVANSANVVVFFKIGAKDNVTILLLCLAMSDMLFLALIAPTMFGFVIEAFVKPNPWPFDFRLMLFLLYWPAYTAYDLSTFISISLGLMRCACVTMPLKFKSIFTMTRTLKWLIFLVVLAVSLRMPVLLINRIGFRKDPITNSSVPYLIAVNGQSMARINDVVNRGVIMYVAFVTMIVCVIILSYKLYEASQTRQSSLAKVPDQSESGAHRLSSKDLQVIQSVTLVCVIFILAQLPLVTVSLTRLIHPQFDQGKRLDPLFGLISQVGVTCSYLNASLNIFVYYRYNSKFRTTFLSLFSLKRNK